MTIMKAITKAVRKSKSASDRGTLRIYISGAGVASIGPDELVQTDEAKRQIRALLEIRKRHMAQS